MKKILISLILAAAITSGCTRPAGTSPLPVASEMAVLASPAAPSATPFQPAEPTFTPTPTPAPLLGLWVSPPVPAAVVNPAFTGILVDSSGDASLRISTGREEGDALEQADWVYALAGPFPTLTDEVSTEDLLTFWQGGHPESFPDQPLLMTSETRQILESILGPAADASLRVVDETSLFDAAYTEPYSWAILPFEELETRWKVITIGGQNPLRREFDPSAYPLVAHFYLNGEPQAYQYALDQESAGSPILAGGNRDPEQMTVLLMTGVTALVRATGWMMDTRGVDFPASDIGDLLRAADITHISNEVSFSPDCPLQDPGSGSLRFCSRPEYFGLLTSIGTDIIELSGNHVNDWGLDAMTYTLGTYREAGIPYFAGGVTQEEARQPVILEDHGNRLAFIGCNEAGPSFAWATETSPGSASCDLDWMEAEIKKLKEEGTVPVVTFQFEESHSPLPMPWQTLDFRRMAEAGAGLVSGSQAHSPQIYEFHAGSFIHYGPGNLFFDQMNVPGLTVATRWEFLDRYTIYQGRIVGVEVITAMLEDWSRPRLMTPAERIDLLTWIFEEGGWNPDK